MHSREDSLTRGSAPRKARYLRTREHKPKINTQAAMSRVGFEPTISSVRMGGGS
jgi:hypothetical protein